MSFKVLSRKVSIPALPGTVFLIEDMWDDWGKYRTMFDLVVCDHLGQRHNIGSVKIGQFGLQPGVKSAPGFRTPASN